MSLQLRASDAGPDTKVDAADVYHSTIFSNSTDEGLGSWGDPDNDFQIFTGGLKDITLAYPVPHHIRRNYSVQPFIGGTDLFGPLAGPVDPELMVNTTLTQANVDFTVNSFTGNYSGFQAYLEGINGPHPGAHFILGADLTGTCPFGMKSPECYPGMKWTSNGRKGFNLDCVHMLTETRFRSYRSDILPSSYGTFHQ